ncbi:MAG: hypothetical protein J2P36_07715 [Ktedonobacteraceae bacterium]|nr:hypothetical protein [Ktedonobacteraceae bacterium]
MEHVDGDILAHGILSIQMMGICRKIGSVKTESISLEEGDTNHAITVLMESCITRDRERYRREPPSTVFLRRLRIAFRFTQARSGTELAINARLSVLTSS